MKFENVTLSHEHMRIDLSKGKSDPDCLLNVLEGALDEMNELAKYGVTRIVDCSNHGIGVDREVEQKIEEKTGIKIVRSTGYYKDPFLPEEVYSLNSDELADVMIREIQNEGIQVIGEIGTSKDEFTERERKVFEAAAIAQKKTGVVIITHTSLGTLIRDQVQFFEEHDVPLNKVILSHVALSNNIDDIRYALDHGANVAFDTIGKIKYLPDETRIEFIKTLLEEGYEDQILMSMDITRKSHLKKNGGVGYTYFFENFIPRLLDEGVDPNKLNQILTKNFTRIMEA